MASRLFYSTSTQYSPHTSASMMQSILIELIIGYIASDFMPFTDFVNFYDWNREALSNTTAERTLISLYCTSRAWAHFARYVLRRRIVIVDGFSGLRRLFAQFDQEDLGSEKGEPAPIRPWVREIYFRGGGREGEPDPVKHVSQLLNRLFRLCPNVESLFLQTTLRDDDYEPFTEVIHSLGDFHHLKALWLRHVHRRRTYTVPNLSEFFVVLPRLRELQRLYVTGWTPFDFNETISKRRPNAPPHVTDPEFSPPETLKTIFLYNVQEMYGSMEADPRAFTWLLSPVDTHKYRPTALAFDILGVTNQMSIDDGIPNSLLECAHDLMATITHLRLIRYHIDNYWLSRIFKLQNCKALESLSIILRAWAERNKFAAPPGVAADDIDERLLPLPALPDTVRTVHIHLEYVGGKWNLEDEVERDRLLVAQMRRLPQVKRFIISRPPLGGDNESPSSPIQTLDMTREYCASVGIEFSVLDSFSPPFF